MTIAADRVVQHAITERTRSRYTDSARWRLIKINRVLADWCAFNKKINVASIYRSQLPRSGSAAQEIPVRASSLFDEYRACSDH
tara:strand:- start:55 stop:306 length:252 start_codon:yes stop_codon:yes gene_type:complete